MGDVVNMRKPEAAYERTAWTTERFFGDPPGEDGYLVVAVRHPNESGTSWDQEVEALVSYGFTPEQAEEVASRYWVDPEWSRDHLSRFHGWTSTEITRWFKRVGSRDHAEEHTARERAENAAALGEEVPDWSGLAIPHTHGDGAAWAIAASSHRSESVRRAVLEIWENLADC